ncbi:DUF1830 domain-containing protein [uncultured Nostoc sp.]|uniref:DUF1830 domain-containing protein n=1 Tax=uncultured Nostoc sp. TaxID=340711 RepID=UPI0035CC6E8E
MSTKFKRFYVNNTRNIEIVQITNQITNIPNCYFERVVFPEERLLFNVNSRDPGLTHSKPENSFA